MKRVVLLCLIGMAALDTRAATSNPPQPVQPFSAVLWTTTTLHSPAGKTFTFMRRTVYTRDASGNVRREIIPSDQGVAARHDGPTRTYPYGINFGAGTAPSRIEQGNGGAGHRSRHLAIFRSSCYGKAADIQGRQWSTHPHVGDMVFPNPGTNRTHGKQ